jgi:hypothetical protein
VPAFSLAQTCIGGWGGSTGGSGLGAGGSSTGGGRVGSGLGGGGLPGGFGFPGCCVAEIRHFSAFFKKPPW